jgi:hypothetical protein
MGITLFMPYAFARCMMMSVERVGPTFVRSKGDLIALFRRLELAALVIRLQLLRVQPEGQRHDRRHAKLPLRATFNAN